MEMLNALLDNFHILCNILHKIMYRDENIWGIKGIPEQYFLVSCSRIIEICVMARVYLDSALLKLIYYKVLDFFFLFFGFFYFPPFLYKRQEFIHSF